MRNTLNNPNVIFTFSNFFPFGKCTPTVLVLIFISLPLLSISQSQPWRGYFSYNEVNFLSQGQDHVFAATDNAYFTNNPNSGAVETKNTIDGLSGLSVTAFYHSIEFKLTFLGYSDGSFNIVNEQTRNIRNVIDIRNQQGIAPNLKQINHFFEHNGLLYISCDFGIVVYRLSTQRFVETYLMGPGGSEVSVQNTTVLNNTIYAVTVQAGIRSATLNSPNLINFQNWQTFNTSNWKKAISLNNQLILVGFDNNVYRWDGNAISLAFSIGQNINDIQSSNSQLLLTTQNFIRLYNANLVQQQEWINLINQQTTVQFTTAILFNNFWYAGTQNHGMVRGSLNNPQTILIQPIGTIRNNVFRIRATESELWVTYGSFTVDFNPFPLDAFGFSRLNNQQWIHVPYENVFNAFNLSFININPRNTNEAYLSSYQSGLLKVTQGTPSLLFTPENSSLESISSTSSTRISASAFDRQGNLWVANSRVGNVLKMKNPAGEWSSVATATQITTPNLNDISGLLIDKNGVKWMGTTHNGVLGYSENGSVLRRISDGTGQGSLPVRDVRAIAIDQRDQLWIGTRAGLRILPTVDRFQNNQSLAVNSIIIVEDDLAQELLFQQFITVIAVDGANNKWIGTADAGVFQVSANGQQTLQRFTSTNSPLPSNTINDISINPINGEVFIATNRGLVSFQGTATGARDDLRQVIVFPNPVRPGYTGTVKITGLMDKVNVKITDISGNLVFETTSQGGTVEWDTTAFGKYKVASGVYMIFLASADGGETEVKKVMIVR
jgi:ligand-binding sensor domain-containing protein